MATRRQWLSKKLGRFIGDDELDDNLARECFEQGEMRWAYRLASSDLVAEFKKKQHAFGIGRYQAAMVKDISTLYVSEHVNLFPYDSALDRYGRNYKVVGVSIRDIGCKRLVYMVNHVRQRCSMGDINEALSCFAENGELDLLFTNLGLRHSRNVSGRQLFGGLGMYEEYQAARKGGSYRKRMEKGHQTRELRGSLVTHEEQLCMKRERSRTASDTYRQTIDFLLTMTESDRCDALAAMLFEVGSVPDLVCRGFNRETVLNITGEDIGYHGISAMKRYRELEGVDRQVYKIAHVFVRESKHSIEAALDAFAGNTAKDDVVSMLGICAGSGCRLISLRDLFSVLGYASVFKDIDRQVRRGNMVRGFAAANGGVDNPFKLQVYQDKAIQTRERLYGAPYSLCDRSNYAGNYL